MYKHENLEGLQCVFIAINKMGQIGGFSVYNGFNYAVRTANGKGKLFDAAFDRKW